MRVLVSGASGFIGGHVITALLEKGYEVIATSASKDHCRSKAWFDKVKYIEYNLNQIVDKNLFQFLQQPDCFIHLAWQGLPNYQSSDHLFQVHPQFVFLNNLVAGGLKNLTVTGTCFEYGMQNGALNEAMNCFPANPYALAKDSLRKFLESTLSTLDCSFKWVRLFYMYGPGQNPRSIIPLLEDALKKQEKVFNMSGGEQIRDYLPVETVADNIIKIAVQTGVGGVINCCSGRPISVRSLVEARLAEKGRTISLNLGYYPYPDYEPFAFWGDATKLNNILNA